MTVFHSTKSGGIELLDSWGHGQPSNGDWASRPATLTVDDGDGHYDAWAFTGSAHDAVIKIAGFFKGDEEAVVTLDHGHVSLVLRHDWIEGVEIVDYDDDGEAVDYHYFPEKQPGGVCMR